MKQLTEIDAEQTSMKTLVELTSIFESIASMRISQIKDQVLQSTEFYHELYNIYSQIHVADVFSFGREKSDVEIINKELMIIITAEGSLSGDIDQKLIELVIKDYDPDKNEIIVIGHHGAIQLSQAQVHFKKYYKMPNRDRDINVMPIVEDVKKYVSAKVYYQEYISLMVQDVKRIPLLSALNERARANIDSKDVINEQTYIFEPSTYAVVAHLERSMMQITISQLILESKLAQYASRFQAMSKANTLAIDMRDDLHLEYSRTKRAIKDERLKEMVNGLKKASLGAV